MTIGYKNLGPDSAPVIINIDKLLVLAPASDQPGTHTDFHFEGGLKIKIEVNTVQAGDKLEALNPA